MTITNTCISVKATEPKDRDLSGDLSVIFELSNFLSASLGFREMLEGAIWKILAHMDLDAGRIYLMDNGRRSFYLAAAIGTDPQGLESINIDQGFTGKAVKMKAFVAQHVSELPDKERAGMLERKGFNIVICIPLIVMDRIIGVMNLATDKEIELDQSEIDFLIAAANQIALSISNALLHAEANRKQKTIDFFRTRFQMASRE